MIDWRAMQAAGCLTPKFHPPGQILPRYLAGGSYHANLHKEGKRHHASRGGSPKPKKRVRLHYQRLPTTVPIDKKGYVIYE